MPLVLKMTALYVVLNAAIMLALALNVIRMRYRTQTRFGDAGNSLATRAVIGLAKRFMAITPEEGARTIVHLASDPAGAGISGRYFIKSRVAQPSLAAQDAAAARRLWEESARLVG